MTRIWNKHKQSNTPLKRKVFVAMSGGVDSSVAAALLKERGFKVVGVFFKPWQPKRGVEFCDWKKDRQDAMTVAAVLSIPFKTWDFSKEYQKKVGNYLINTYRQGLTPNPDVQCNKEIKFGLFLTRALREGADFIATGHYVRKRWHNSNLRIKPGYSKYSEYPDKNSENSNYTLLKARDKNKDQSYFLWTLTQKQLKYCLFPIGDYLKPEVRKLAKKLGLPNYAKKDSQGVCFVGQLDMKDFLKSYLSVKPGEIVLAGIKEIVGRHDGAHFYTIGQRHGLNINNGQGPYFVSGKNLQKNVLYVSKETGSQLFNQGAAVNQISWVNGFPKFSPLSLKAKIRYRTPEIPVKTLRRKGQDFGVKFKNPAKALAPGQSIVFYRGEEVLGGGVLKNSLLRERPRKV